MKDFIITLLFGWAGVHKFMQKKTAMGILYLFTFGLFGIGWIVDIMRVIPSINFQKENNIIKIGIVGEAYRKRDICSVVSGNRMYNLPDNEFIEKFEVRKNVYRYKYRETDATLVPEPTNPHDHNAIKVMIDNFHVGYIPAEMCVELKNKLKSIKLVTAKIYGGDYKYHTGYEVFKVERDFSIDIYVKM